MAGPTIVIDLAGDGVPGRAHCDTCGQTWDRPPYDHRADTLPVWALDHRRQCPGPD